MISNKVTFTVFQADSMSEYNRVAALVWPDFEVDLLGHNSEGFVGLMYSGDRPYTIEIESAAREKLISLKFDSDERDG